MDRYRQRINFHVAEEHKPTGISMKARIRDVSILHFWTEGLPFA